MLTLAIVMLVNPAFMNQMSTSLVIFVVAFAVAGLVLVTHRLLLPHYGIYVGTENRLPQATPASKHPHHRRHAR